MAENKMEQYCKLPIPITAYQTKKEMDIETLEGTMHASVGDYIITGVNGEQYPCKFDIFEKTYIKCGQTNKMEQVAAMFGKRLGERFTVERDHDRFDCRFMQHGLETFGVYENPYMSFDAFILEELLTGRVVIVDD